jgi:prepilin signal peptidase PulO-like enzyme (type II secretory pathway)
MEWIFLIWFFCLGLIVGSFLNVVIVRFNTGLSFTKGRSMCFSCGKSLGFFELIPLVSFVLQGGRCRGCKSKLSPQYFLVELLTGLTFVSVFLTLSPSDALGWIVLFLTLIVFALLIVIVAYDIRHMSIPNVFSYSFAVLSLGILFLKEYPMMPSVPDMLSGIILSAFFLFLWIITRGKGIGLGDAKLALGMGWFLGLSSGVASLFLAFWIGTVYVLALMVWQKYKSVKRLTFKSEIPFGPFLVAAVYICFFFSLSFDSLTGFFSS